MQYDLYMSFNKKDEEKVQEITDLLTSFKKDIRIFRDQQDLKEDKAWQDDIHQVMIKCRR